MTKVKTKLLEYYNGLAQLDPISPKTVSLVIPIRKPSKDEIIRTFESLNASVDKNFECVLVFDGNETVTKLPEGTPLITDEIDVQVISIDGVSGPSVARNTGVFASKNEVITYMDIGDVMNPERIKHLKGVYTAVDDLEMLFSAYSVSHPSAGMQFFDSNELFKKALERGKGGKHLLSHNVRFPAGSVSHKRRPFYVVGGFQPNIKSGEEEVLWRRMADVTPEEFIAADDFDSGIKHFQDNNKKEYKHFEINFKDKGGSNGQYLDDWWYETLNNKGFQELDAE